MREPACAAPPDIASCPACAEPLLPNARFCAKCGVSLTPRACAACQASVAIGARFCSSCGVAVAS
ncbi:double zinc ribbon domain-containing protein [Denitromonas sp.]|uniref:double zinc ribbon domain-containing protein n=1 Tax=Denitromonas sp. TaxID=2734609 RepID=UPI003A598CD6